MTAAAPSGRAGAGAAPGPRRAHGALLSGPVAGGRADPRCGSLRPATALPPALILASDDDVQRLLAIGAWGVVVLAALCRGVALAWAVRAGVDRIRGRSRRSMQPRSRQPGPPVWPGRWGRRQSISPSRCGSSPGSSPRAWCTSWASPRSPSSERRGWRGWSRSGCWPGRRSSSGWSWHWPGRWWPAKESPSPAPRRGARCSSGPALSWWPIWPPHCRHSEWPSWCSSSSA